MKISLAMSVLLLSTLLQAESIEESFAGFDDTSVKSTTSSLKDEMKASPETTVGKNDFTETQSEESENRGTTVNEPEMEGFDDDKALFGATSSVEKEESEDGFFSYFSGKVTQQGAVSYNDARPQNVFGSLRQSFFLNYERTLENGLKIRVNGRAFYDPIYDVSNADFYPAEVEELRTEVELFEAYLEWSVSDVLDVKLGRQVVVWGRSDTIRIADVLNPIDNRRPGYVDLENLYLPRTMLKFDYQLDKWRISPIIILEQRFTKDPPFGSIYNPFSPPMTYSEWVEQGGAIYSLGHESYSDPTFALSIGGEFEGWDVNFYVSRLYEDRGYIPYAELPEQVLEKKYRHNKTNMFAAAVNILYGSLLFKSELAYFNNLTYTATQDRSLSRSDLLLGLEYSGIANTTLSYDFAVRHFNKYDPRLFVPEENYLEQNTYQQAFRINSNFVSDTLHANYLVSVFGKKADEGGFQRAWIDYEVADAINTEIGVIDYFGGTPLFDLVKDQIVVFMDMSYNF